MYDNIGKKIKILAQVFCIIEAIGAAIASIALMVDDEDSIPIGLLILIVGPFVAWVSSWLLYGFGELIDKTSEIARNTYNGERKSEALFKIDYERISKIEKLRSQGLITEEEYQQAISKYQ